MNKLFFPVIVFSMLPLLSSCNRHSTSEKEKVENVADSFATALYNYDYGKALKLGDDDSKKAIYLITGNLTEKDMEVIRNARTGASVKVTDVDMDREDSTAVVTLKVENFFMKDSIGSTGHIVDQATWLLPLRKIKGNWLVEFKNIRPEGK